MGHQRPRGALANGDLPLDEVLRNGHLISFNVFGVPINVSYSFDGVSDDQGSAFDTNDSGRFSTHHRWHQPLGPSLLCPTFPEAIGCLRRWQQRGSCGVCLTSEHSWNYLYGVDHEWFDVSFTTAGRGMVATCRDWEYCLNVRVGSDPNYRAMRYSQLEPMNPYSAEIVYDVGNINGDNPRLVLARESYSHLRPPVVYRDGFWTISNDVRNLVPAGLQPFY